MPEQDFLRRPRPPLIPIPEETPADVFDTPEPFGAQLREAGSENQRLKERIAEIAKSLRERNQRKFGAAVARTRTEHVQTALQRVSERRGIPISLEDFEQMRQLTVMEEEPASRRDRAMQAAAHTVVEEVMLVASGMFGDDLEAILAELENLNYEHAATIARLEDKAYLHEKSGLLRSYEAIRDRFSLLRDSVIAERDTDEVIVVLEIDLVGLKALNEQFGNTTVDNQIMQRIGERMRGEGKKLTGIHSLRTADIAAQLGGDEFQVIAKTKAAGVTRFIELVQKIFEGAPFTVNGQSVDIKVRIGAQVRSLDNLRMIQTHDAFALVDELRQHPLEAAKFVKLTTNSGSVVWKPDLKIPQEALHEVTVDAALRGVTAVADEIRKAKGAEAASKYKHAVAELTRTYLTE